MENAKPIMTPLGQHFKLSTTQCPQTEEERTRMEMFPILMQLVV